MTFRRTTARLCAIPAAATAAAVLVAAPAAAHVTGTVSSAAAGAFTVMTFSVPHGCESSPTTRIEIQVPETVLSVTPTRNPLYEVEAVITALDEPVTDAHGNEVTERTSSIVYTADTPLPEGQRDTFELSFQVPDAVGEVLAFPTVQTCEEGETGWVEVPAAGQDAEELEHPAPAFEILAADPDADSRGDAGADEASAAAEPADGSDALAWTGLAVGLVGVALGGTALARSRVRA